ncbi:MAG: diaminopimelate epimerase [Sulfurovaceae bacterium]|nr:diaminopimelate epimerase [Sulfurovaceae bacterium]MDD5549305.1 diaminopimelate epimerase [Sulfurovaceae bacterium]
MTVTKYNASGNDFIIFHSHKKDDRSDMAIKLCDRHSGVGADGMVVLVPSETYDFEWEFYNSNGSTAPMCGNASRATAHYACEKGISLNNKAIFLTGAGVISVAVNGDYATTDMTRPEVLDKTIEEFGREWWLIDTGVPHLVAFVEDISIFDIQIAKELRYKYNANVNIAFVDINNDCLNVRTYERGVEDETLACGTGMVACFVRANIEKLVGNNVKVYPKSKEEIYISLDEGIYKFGGRISKVFEAEVFI